MDFHTLLSSILPIILFVIGIGCAIFLGVTQGENWKADMFLSWRRNCTIIISLTPFCFGINHQLIQDSALRIIVFFIVCCILGVLFTYYVIKASTWLYRGQRR
jgi:hypothetical protein